MISKFHTQAEAEAAVVEFYQARNAGRGQYPQRISAKRTLREINPDGSLLFTYTYKGETTEMLKGTYSTIVTFDVPAKSYTL